MDIDYQLMVWRLRPTSEYHWRGGQNDVPDSYDSIGEWRDPLTTKPTEAEIIAEWDKYQTELLAEQVANG